MYAFDRGERMSLPLQAGCAKEEQALSQHVWMASHPSMVHSPSYSTIPGINVPYVCHVPVRKHIQTYWQQGSREEQKWHFLVDVKPEVRPWTLPGARHCSVSFAHAKLYAWTKIYTKTRRYTQSPFTPTSIKYSLKQVPSGAVTLQRCKGHVCWPSCVNAVLQFYNHQSHAWPLDMESSCAWLCHMCMQETGRPFS